MADEHDELPDTTRIVSDIQKAMSAYGEFQMQLADAMKPWQNQWAALQEQLAPLLSAIEPIQEEVTTAAIKWCAVQESWQEHSAAIQDAAARWAGAWTEAQAAIVRELAEIGPRLRRTLESAAHVGRLGWTVTMKMMPIDMSTLADMQISVPGDLAVQTRTPSLRVGSAASPKRKQIFDGRWRVLNPRPVIRRRKTFRQVAADER